MAICLVVFHHSLTSPVSQALRSAQLTKPAELLEYVTRSGVELFFVLSGVVLLRPYLRGMRRFRTLAYLRRRVERLWPPFGAGLLVAGVVIAIASLHPTWYSIEVLPHFSLSGWAAQLGIVNLGWSSYSGAWWSLSLEVVFYLLVPLLVAGMMASRSPQRSLATLFIVAVAASLVVAAWFNPEAATRDPSTGEQTAIAVAQGVDTFATLFALYLPCFLMGAGLALRDVRPRTGILLTVGGAAYAPVALLAPQLNIHLAFAALWGGVVIVAMQGGGRMRRVLASDPLIWLGERSYSLFLIHFPVFYLVNYVASLFVPRRNSVYLAVSRGVGLPLALLAAMVLFWVVERRFARGLATADRFWPVPARSSGAVPSLDTAPA